MSKRLHRLVLGLALLIMASLLLAPPALAAKLPGSVHPLPNPPGAPQTDTFLITIPHHNVVPMRAVFTFRDQGGSHSTQTSSLKKLDKYQYEALWRATAQGQVRVRVYAAQNRLIASGAYRVGPSKENPIGRVLVGALFIGGSLWFWWRQQRYSRRT